MLSTLSLAFGLSLMGQAAKPWPVGPVDLSAAQTLDGRPAQLAVDKAPATVFIFVATDCPIANRYAPEIERIYALYSKRGVSFYRVYLEPAKQRKAILAHMKAFHQSAPALLDPNRKLAKSFGATVTPEVLVIGPDRLALYRGRIDDQNVEHGKIRPDYRRDLRLALDQILAGKPVEVRQTTAIGCFIGD